jgi:hypothetical protein
MTKSSGLTHSAIKKTFYAEKVKKSEKYNLFKKKSPYNQQYNRWFSTGYLRTSPYT